MIKLIKFAMFMCIISSLTMVFSETTTMIGLTITIVIGSLLWWAAHSFVKQFTMVEVVHNYVIRHDDIHTNLEEKIKRNSQDTARLETDLKKQMDKMEGKLDEVIKEINRLKISQ